MKNTTAEIMLQIEKEMRVVRERYPDAIARELDVMRDFLMKGAVIGSSVIQQAWIEDTQRTVAKIKTVFPDKK